MRESTLIMFIFIDLIYHEFSIITALNGWCQKKIEYNELENIRQLSNMLENLVGKNGCIENTLYVFSTVYRCVDKEMNK